MAEKSAISWTTSTFNPWIGCTRISVAESGGGGCDNCYAEELDRQRLSKTLGGGTKDIPIIHWGAGAPRYRTSASNWNGPHKWNKAQEKAMNDFALGRTPRPAPWRVFCASLADVFDNAVDPKWRDDLWALIRATPYLEWLLVTKRVPNVEKMFPGGDYPNVRLMITIVNEKEAQRDVERLLALPFKNGISYEPALGPVDWTPWLYPSHWGWDARYRSPEEALAAGAYAEKKPQAFVWAGSKFIDWIIVGGESSQRADARPFEVEWARSTIKQGRESGTPIFVKQLGSRPHWQNGQHVVGCALKDRAGANMDEWPEDLRVQQFPKEAYKRGAKL